MNQILLCDWLFGWTDSLIPFFGIRYILVCTMYCWFGITVAVKSSLLVLTDVSHATKIQNKDL